MRVNTLYCANSVFGSYIAFEIMYIGLCERGTNITGIIFALDNDPVGNKEGIDRPRFVFTYLNNPYVALISEWFENLKATRIVPKGNGSWFEIGNNNINPQQQLHVLDDDLNTSSRHTQLRLSQKLNHNTLSIYTDFQTTEPNNNYDAGNTRIEAHLLINTHRERKMRIATINIKNNNPPINPCLVLDVNEQINIRTVNHNNNLMRVLVINPTQKNRIMWYDISTIGCMDNACNAYLHIFAKFMFYKSKIMV